MWLFIETAVAIEEGAWAGQRTSFRLELERASESREARARSLNALLCCCDPATPPNQSID